MNEHDDEPRHDELDIHIRSALHVEEDIEQAARLAAFWQRQSHRQRRRRTVAVVSSLAATIVAAVTVVLHLRNQNVPHVAVATNEIEVEPRASTDDMPELVAAPESPKKLDPNVREPTAYERFVFAARSPETTGRMPPEVAVSQLIDRIAGAPEAKVEAFVQSSSLNRMVIERELLRRLPHSNARRVGQMLPLLADCATARSLPTVLRLAEDSELRPACLTIVERIGGAEGIAQWAGQTSNQEVRALACRRLLTRDEESLDSYLRLVRESGARRDILAVASDISQPVVERLLHRLEHEERDVRLAVALVLSEARGQGVAEALIARVTREDERIGDREAWIALMNSRSQQAVNFLAFAAGQPRLMGAFRRARNWSLVNLPNS